jgi:hypothetical protein
MRRTRGSSPRWGVTTYTLCQSPAMRGGQAEVLDFTVRWQAISFY